MNLFVCRAQTLMKSRLKGAQKGHSLLKKKADALQMRFRLILSKIIEVSVTCHENPVHSVAGYTNSGSSRFPAFFNINHDYKIRSQIFFSNLKGIPPQHYSCVTILALHDTILVVKSNQFVNIFMLQLL